MVPAEKSELASEANEYPPGSVRVEVVYAEPRGQKRVQLTMRAGATVEDALRASGLLKEFADIDIHSNPVGIFGCLATLGTLLAAYNRVEIYRPLKRDPKDRRRRHAGDKKPVRRP